MQALPAVRVFIAKLQRWFEIEEALLGRYLKCLENALSKSTVLLAELSESMWQPLMQIYLTNSGSSYKVVAASLLAKLCSLQESNVCL